jgi:hypothetical protein
LGEVESYQSHNDVNNGRTDQSMLAKAFVLREGVLEKDCVR